LMTKAAEDMMKPKTMKKGKSKSGGEDSGEGQS
jgi:spore germination protein D